MIKPAALRRGDRVAIISPSGTILPERVDGACKALRQWGFEPVVGQHVLCQHRSWGAVNTGGTDDDRLADLLWAITDPSVKAILCSRGGYGTVRLLERVDASLISQNPKWLIGFSDISALHALWHRAGVMSLHASMAKQLTDHGTTGEVSEAMHAFITASAMPPYAVAPHPFNRSGEASGMLVGGNLAVLSALVGTPYNLLKPGCILFIEDVGEEIYRVERLLHQLRLAGVLPSLKGLIVGQFTRYHLDGALADTATDAHHHLYSMIAHMVAPYAYPVAFDFPIGHVDRNLPLPEGTTAHLQVSPSTTTLTFTP
ncbi:MAG: LD-carboxypeptidase [Bacteroidales bacterium]|nr:LD-carboxypeptidase [Bacteroidales bacterium]